MKVQGESLSQEAPLGRAIKAPEPEPKPHEKVREGVYRDEAGKLYTQIPEPPQPSIWDQWKQAGMI